MMTEQADLIHDLQTLNQISITLNGATDVQAALNKSLAQLVDLMGLETGWIFVTDAAASDRWSGRGFRLAAHYNLPPVMAVTEPIAWDRDCDCQHLCRTGLLTGAFNEVHCSRLAGVTGDRRDLAVHASSPLKAADRVLGILNVAAADWSQFTPRSLALLANAGSQMGIALERASLFDSLKEQRIHEQAALLDLSQQLLSRRGLDEMMSFIAQEARRLLDADAGAILLAVEDVSHLEFRAASGWRTDPVGARYTVPADEQSGSGRVLASQQPLISEDLSREDVHRWTAEWLEAEEFRAAAIAPLMVDGRSIGTLVIDSRTPRQFSDTEVRFLRLMANQAALAIEQERLLDEEFKRHRMEEELAVGRQIQVSMLPLACPILPGWEFAAAFESALQVSGDFYDFFPLPGEAGRWGIAIADVAGKGVPAALFMALSRTTIRNVALRGREPAEVISWANRFIQEDSQSDLFLTAFYGELNTDSGVLTYANAGHNPPLVWRAARQDFDILPPTSPLIGVLENLEVEVKTSELASGDVLVLYTDGITEALNEEQEEFGVRRLRSTIRRELTQGHATASRLCAAIVAAVDGFANEVVQADDLTLLIIKRTEEQHEPA